MKQAASILVFLVTGPAWAQGNIDNSALQCGSDATFFPRGDHWAAQPGFYEEYHQHEAGAPGISNGSDFFAINEAFSAWVDHECTPGNVANVDIRDSQTRVTARDRGDTYDSQERITSWSNVSYFVIDQPSWPADELTVALTTNVRIADTGFLITADIEFNAWNYQWRATNSGGVTTGCAATLNTCFDLQTVATHEVGHFIGFNHVSCADAVMFPETTNSMVRRDLALHETTGLCTIYPPRDPALTSAQRTFGEQCENSSQCVNSALCIKPVGAGATSPYGWCTDPCNTTTECPTGFTCVQLLEGTQKFCRPGPNNTGGAATNVTNPTGEAVDLCTPCTSGAQCSSGLCVTDGTATAICTQGCTAGLATGEAGGCPSGLSCVDTGLGYNVCWPDDPANCGASDPRRGLNEECYDVAPSVPPQYTPCGPDLSCVVFRETCQGQKGSCVSYCNESDQPCADPNLTCCAGVDANGECVPLSPTNPHGGCFEIRFEGDSCVSPEQSVCSSGLGCFYFASPVEATCYALCANNSQCGSNQTCVSAQDGCGLSTGLCCDTEAFNSRGVCETDRFNGLYDLGVECEVNGDCRSNLCLKYNGQAACSRSCNAVTGYGCPGNIDVNGDFIGDGGYDCLFLNNAGRCWPKNGPIEPPGGGNANPPPGGGCCYAPGARPSLAQLALDLLIWIPLLVWRRRRKLK